MIMSIAFHVFRNLIFGDYMTLDEKVYDEIKDLEQLTIVMNG